jgi:predicted transcriptional regulator
MENAMNNTEPNSRYANFCIDLKDELILNTLTKYPGSMVKEVAEATGLKEITCRYHLTTLENVGLIRSEKRRKYLHYFIEPAPEQQQ